MTDIIMGALFMFIFKETSRNAYNNDRREDTFFDNIYRIFKRKLPHGDTIKPLLDDIEPEAIVLLKANLVSFLFEQKLFRKFRLFGTHYFVAVDATGITSYNERHCKHCLTKTSKNGNTTYFHYVLEAKLVTSSGLAVSIASEFIENQEGRNFDKQDCEMKAFVRLAKKIKSYFPRLPICILGDALYPNNTVFEICRKHNWLFVITLKDKCLKSFNEEVGLLKNTASKRSVIRTDKLTKTTLNYSFLNEIEYDKNYYSWIEITEEVLTLKDKTTVNQRFSYITNIAQTLDSVMETADGGRLRWKIENQGFNTLKNDGYEMQHKFSRTSYKAMQNYYHILQIAHIINQLVEKSGQITDLLEEHSKQTIKDLWKKLIAFLTMIAWIETEPG